VSVTRHNGVSFGALLLLIATGVCTLIHGVGLADPSEITLMTERNYSFFSHWSYVMLGPMAYALNVDGFWPRASVPRAADAGDPDRSPFL
jgi:hypothetical protein